MGSLNNKIEMHRIIIIIVIIIINISEIKSLTFTLLR